MNEIPTKAHLIEKIAALEGTPIEQTPVELATAIKEAAPDTPIIMLPGFAEMTLGAGQRPSGIDRLLG